MVTFPLRSSQTPSTGLRDILPAVTAQLGGSVPESKAWTDRPNAPVPVTAPRAVWNGSRRYFCTSCLRRGPEGSRRNRRQNQCYVQQPRRRRLSKSQPHLVCKQHFFCVGSTRCHFRVVGQPAPLSGLSECLQGKEKRLSESLQDCRNDSG